MKVVFRTAGTCGGCGGPVEGLLTHEGYPRSLGIRIASDDPGVRVWICPGGCVPWAIEPVDGFTLVEMAEWSHDLVEDRRPPRSKAKRSRTW